VRSLRCAPSLHRAPLDTPLSHNTLLHVTCSIYEKIGKGKHSVVYKGRKKKTIQYYAVKSVEKSQKGRVLQEVCFACVSCVFVWQHAATVIWRLTVGLQSPQQSLCMVAAEESSSQ